jgi:hypothetical protein
MTEQTKLRGWDAYHAHRRQDEADRQSIIDGLLADLHREATTADKLAVEQVAALTIHARRLERRGQFDRAATIRDQITRATRAFGVIKPQPPATAPKKSFAEKIEEAAAARHTAEAAQ